MSNKKNKNVITEFEKNFGKVKKGFDWLQEKSKTSTDYGNRKKK